MGPGVYPAISTIVGNYQISWYVYIQGCILASSTKNSKGLSVILSFYPAL